MRPIRRSPQMWTPREQPEPIHTVAGRGRTQLGMRCSHSDRLTQSVPKRLFVLRVARGQDVVSQARARGVEAGAIGTVGLTHLHYDHAGGAGQLPHATFLFDSREWAPAVRGRLLEGYRRGTVDRPLDWRTLEFAGATAGAGFSHTLDLFGDDSVRLVSTPGHSPGHLSVLLRTASGPVLLWATPPIPAARSPRVTIRSPAPISLPTATRSRVSGDGLMPIRPHPSSAATTTNSGQTCQRSTRERSRRSHLAVQSGGGFHNLRPVTFLM
jgi:Metallo-beta-lactamase superfamily